MIKDFSDIVDPGEPDFTALDVVDAPEADSTTLNIVDPGEPDFTTLDVVDVPEPDFTNLELKSQVSKAMPEKDPAPTPVKKTIPKRVYYSGAGIPVGRIGMSAEQVQEEAPKLRAIGRDIQRVGFGAARNLTGAVINNVLSGMDVNIDDMSPENRDKFLNKATAAALEYTSPVLSIDWNNPTLVDEKGRLQTVETTEGAVLQVGAIILGGAKATKVAEISMKGIKNAPKLVKAGATIFGYEASAQVFSNLDENIFNVIQDAVAESDDPEAEYSGKVIIDFMAAKEDDAYSTKQLKLLVEGLGFSAVLGTLGFLPKSYTLARQKVLGKRLDEMTESEANEELLRYMKEVKENQSVKDLKGLQETEAGLKQVEAQATGEGTLIGKVGKAVSEIKYLEGVGRATTKAAKYLTKIKQQTFTSRGYATPLMYEAALNAKFAQKQLITAAENIGNRLNIAFEAAGNDKKLLKKINTLISSDLSKVFKIDPEKRVAYFAKQRNIPEDVASEILEARSLIDELSEKILKTDGFSDEAKASIEAGLNTYIRRSYRAFEDPGYVPTTVVQTRAKNYIVRNIVDDAKIKADKKGVPLSEQQLNTIKTNAGKTADAEIEEMLGNTDELVDYVAQVQRVGKFHKKNKELAPEIRELLGEVKNPSENIILSISKAARILEMQNFYNTANQLGKRNYILGAEAAKMKGGRYTTKITGTNSILDGKMTTPEMAMFLSRKEETYEVLENNNAAINAYKYYIGAKGFAQSMKTTYSHTTHARNVVGGYQFGLANGRLWSHVKSDSMKVLKNKVFNTKGKIDKKALDAQYEEYLGLGIINTSVNVNQFREMLETGFEVGAPKVLKPFEKTLKQSEAAVKTVEAGKRSKSYDTIVNKPNEIYMASDDFFKIGAYEAELKTLREAFPNANDELLKQQAAKIVRNTMPNYDQVPKGVKALRNLPMGNFVAFPAEIVRTSMHIIKQASTEIGSSNQVIRTRGLQRLAGAVSTQVGFGAIANASHDAMGFSDQDVEDRRILASGPFSSGHDLIYTREENGDVYALNTQYLNSYYSLLSFAREGYDEIQSGRLKGQALDEMMYDATEAAVLDFIKPYTDESIASTPLRSLVTAMLNENGRDSEGRQIINDKDGVEWGQVMKSFYKSFVPGSVVSVMNLIDAETGKASTYDTSYRNPKYERIEQTGFKWDKQDLEGSFKSLVKDYRVLDRQNYIDRLKINTTVESSREDYLKTNAVKFQNSQDLYITVAAAKRQLGTPIVLKVLQGEGFSEQDAILMARGEFRPEKVPEDVMKKKISTIKKLRTFEEREEFKSVIKESEAENTDLYKALYALPLDNAGEYETTVDEKEKEYREELATGGVVSEPVANAPIEPDERIDKLTGLPYNERAGMAYMDIEDPLRALNMAAGGRVKKSAGGELLKMFIKKTAPSAAPVIKQADEIVESATYAVVKDKKGNEFVGVSKSSESTEDSLGLTPESIEAWKKEQKGFKQPKVPEVVEAVEKLAKKEIDEAEFDTVVNTYKPIKPITEVPDLPTPAEIASALDSNKRATGIVNVNLKIEDGTSVASRLDIPAYEQNNTWVVSLHDGSKRGGASLGYGQTAVLDNVKFSSEPKAAINIAKGKPKATIARMYGSWKNQKPEDVHALAKQYMDDPEWTQVGMNPDRHSFFYDKLTGEPVTSAEQVIQVGPLVLAKNVTKTSRTDPMFSINPKDPDAPRFAAGGKVLSALKRNCN